MTKDANGVALLNGVGMLGVFRPCAVQHPEMDMLSVYARDETTINAWADFLFLEPLVSVRGTVIGFHLVNFRHLQGEKTTMNVSKLLFRAFAGDMWRNRKRRITRIKVVALYAKAYSLLLRHPTTWWLKKI